MDQTDHFTDDFVRENVAYRYDVRFNSLQPILFREIHCRKMDKLMF